MCTTGDILDAALGKPLGYAAVSVLSSAVVFITTTDIC